MGEALLRRDPSPEASARRQVASVSGITRSTAARDGLFLFWRKIVWGLVIVAAFGAGWVAAGVGLRNRDKEALPPETGIRGGERSAAMVTVEPVTLRSVQRAVEGIGTLHAFEEITIAARVEGRVRELKFDVADNVKPGELLLQIDPTDYELAVEQSERALQVELVKLGLTDLPDSKFDLEKVPSVLMAQSKREKAQLRVDRVRKLLTSQAVAVENADNANADLRIAEAEYANELLLGKALLTTIRMKQTTLAMAQQQLADTKVRSPTPTAPMLGFPDGVLYAVSRRNVSEGTLVQPGTEICKLVIYQTLKLQLPIPERFSSEIQVGQKVDVHTAAVAAPRTGTVTRINPAVEPATRTFVVEVQVPNPEGTLKPGSFAKAAILTRVDPEAVTVPLGALVNFAGINKIFLAHNGQASTVPVTLGVQSTEWVEISKPALPRDATVITSGQTVLAEGTPVTVREAQESQAIKAVQNGRGETTSP